MLPLLSTNFTMSFWTLRYKSRSNHDCRIQNCVILTECNYPMFCTHEPCIGIRTEIHLVLFFLAPCPSAHFLCCSKRCLRIVYFIEPKWFINTFWVNFVQKSQPFCGLFIHVQFNRESPRNRFILTAKVRLNSQVEAAAKTAFARFKHNEHITAAVVAKFSQTGILLLCRYRHQYNEFRSILSGNIRLLQRLFSCHLFQHFRYCESQN